MSSSSSSDIESICAREELVTFHDVPRRYPPGYDIRVYYSVGSQVTPTPLDWIGIFKNDWRDTCHPLTFQWAPVTTIKLPLPVNRLATFPAYLIQSLEDQTQAYKFVYVTQAGHVIGVSPSFMVRLEDEWDLDMEIYNKLPSADKVKGTGQVVKGLANAESPLELSSDEDWEFTTGSPPTIKADYSLVSDLSDIVVLSTSPSKERALSSRPGLHDVADSGGLLPTSDVADLGRPSAEQTCSDQEPGLGGNTTVRAEPVGEEIQSVMVKLSEKGNSRAKTKNKIQKKTHLELGIKSKPYPPPTLSVKDESETCVLHDHYSTIPKSIQERLRIVDIESSKECIHAEGLKFMEHQDTKKGAGKKNSRKKKKQKQQCSIEIINDYDCKYNKEGMKHSEGKSQESHPERNTHNDTRVPVKGSDRKRKECEKMKSTKRKKSEPLDDVIYVGHPRQPPLLNAIDSESAQPRAASTSPLCVPTPTADSHTVAGRDLTEDRTTSRAKRQCIRGLKQTQSHQITTPVSKEKANSIESEVLAISDESCEGLDIKYSNPKLKRKMKKRMKMKNISRNSENLFEVPQHSRKSMETDEFEANQGETKEEHKIKISRDELNAIKSKYLGIKKARTKKRKRALGKIDMTYNLVNLFQLWDDADAPPAGANVSGAKPAETFPAPDSTILPHKDQLAAEFPSLTRETPEGSSTTTTTTDTIIGITSLTPRQGDDAEVVEVPQLPLSGAGCPAAGTEVPVSAPSHLPAYLLDVMDALPPSIADSGGVRSLQDWQRTRVPLVTRSSMPAFKARYKSKFGKKQDLRRVKRKLGLCTQSGVVDNIKTSLLMLSGVTDRTRKLRSPIADTPSALLPPTLHVPDTLDGMPDTGRDATLALPGLLAESACVLMLHHLSPQGPSTQDPADLTGGQSAGPEVKSYASAVKGGAQHKANLSSLADPSSSLSVQRCRGGRPASSDSGVSCREDQSRDMERLQETPLQAHCLLIPTTSHTTGLLPPPVPAPENDHPPMRAVEDLELVGETQRQHTPPRTLKKIAKAQRKKMKRLRKNGVSTQGKLSAEGNVSCYDDGGLSLNNGLFQPSIPALVSSQSMDAPPSLGDDSCLCKHDPSDDNDVTSHPLAVVPVCGNARLLADDDDDDFALTWPLPSVLTSAAAPDSRWGILQSVVQPILHLSTSARIHGATALIPPARSQRTCPTAGGTCPMEGVAPWGLCEGGRVWQQEEEEEDKGDEEIDDRAVQLARFDRDLNTALAENCEQRERLVDMERRLAVIQGRSHSSPTQDPKDGDDTRAKVKDGQQRTKHSKRTGESKDVLKADVEVSALISKVMAYQRKLANKENEINSLKEALHTEQKRARYAEAKADKRKSKLKASKLKVKSLELETNSGAFKPADPDRTESCDFEPPHKIKKLGYTDTESYRRTEADQYGTDPSEDLLCADFMAPRKTNACQPFLSPAAVVNYDKYGSKNTEVPFPNVAPASTNAAIPTTNWTSCVSTTSAPEIISNELTTLTSHVIPSSQAPLCSTTQGQKKQQLLWQTRSNPSVLPATADGIPQEVSQGLPSKGRSNTDSPKRLTSPPHLPLRTPGYPPTGPYLQNPLPQFPLLSHPRPQHRARAPHLPLPYPTPAQQPHPNSWARSRSRSPQRSQRHVSKSPEAFVQGVTRRQSKSPLISTGQYGQGANSTAAEERASFANSHLQAQIPKKTLAPWNTHNAIGGNADFLHWRYDRSAKAEGLGQTSVGQRCHLLEESPTFNLQFPQFQDKNEYKAKGMARVNPRVNNAGVDKVSSTSVCSHYGSQLAYPTWPLFDKCTAIDSSQLVDDSEAHWPYKGFSDESVLNESNLQPLSSTPHQNDDDWKMPSSGHGLYQSSFLNQLDSEEAQKYGPLLNSKVTCKRAKEQTHATEQLCYDFPFTHSHMVGTSGRDLQYPRDIQEDVPCDSKAATYKIAEARSNEYSELNTVTEGANFLPNFYDYNPNLQNIHDPSASLDWCPDYKQVSSIGNDKDGCSFTPKTTPQSRRSFCPLVTDTPNTGKSSGSLAYLGCSTCGSKFDHQINSRLIEDQVASHHAVSASTS